MRHSWLSCKSCGSVWGRYKLCRYCCMSSTIYNLAVETVTCMSHMCFSQ